MRFHLCLVAYLLSLLSIFISIYTLTLKSETFLPTQFFIHKYSWAVRPSGSETFVGDVGLLLPHVTRPSVSSFFCVRLSVTLPVQGFLFYPSWIWACSVWPGFFSPVFLVVHERPHVLVIIFVFVSLNVKKQRIKASIMGLWIFNIFL